MTTRRGVVLAGGGLAGIAWETGVLLGISDEVPSAARALVEPDVLVGTSAGSTVAAQISSGVALDELFACQLRDAEHELTPSADIDDLTELFVSAVLTPGTSTTQKLQRIGVIAADTATVPEAARLDVISHRLPSHVWPEVDLRISAIDIATGELVTFDRDSGVGLVEAVAASCAVPGAWPPVSIGRHRYMDGGVGSSVNMALAQDCDAVVVLVPAGETAPSPFGGGAAEEIATFAGATFAVFADDAALAAFGPNPLDPRCRRPSALAGREQGRAVADPVAAFLGL